MIAGEDVLPIPPPLARPVSSPIEEAAMAAGCSDRAALVACLNDPGTGSVVNVILESGLVEEKSFLKELAHRLRLPWIPSPEPILPATVKSRFPARLALRRHIFPMGGDRLRLLIYDPFDLVARQAAHQAVSEPIEWVMGSRRDVLECLRHGYGVGAETFDQILQGRDPEELSLDLKQETTILDADDEEASVVRFVNQIIREALEEGATDIHLEPVDDSLRIRYRVDGVLHATPIPEQIRLLQASVISRLKIMAHLDIAERRLPQDGRINLELDGKPIDVRVATIPSVAGESISLRLLGQEKFDFARVGLDESDLHKVRDLLAMPNGIVLLTGPTGCGKSTTLYTFLSSLNTEQRRIVTIEDPVEHKLPGVVQIAVKSEINLTFANALRSVLRGDPNVIMVGEMRDLETAEIAIRSALTGHLVFSTLHTNDAIGGITRLIDMGIEPFLVGASVRAFIAQRLVRLLCPHCRVPAEAEPTYLRGIGFPVEFASTLMKPKGCERCRQTGYQGRTAIMEICLISEKLQEAINRRESANILKQIAQEEGMTLLRQAGWKKAIQGRTSLEEVLRVTASDLKGLDE